MFVLPCAITYFKPFNNASSANFKIKEHKFFIREGIDINFRLPLSIVQASLGDKVTVPTLDGDYEINIPPGTQSGNRFRLSGKGVAQLRGNRRGCLLYTSDAADE